MDHGGISNQQSKSTARAPRSGIVIREPTRTTTNVTDQDMPIANITKIMRRVLPPNTNIDDDAKELIQKCVSEFISFITGEANDKCQGEQRTIVLAEDVLSAMKELGFVDYLETLTIFLNKHRSKDQDRNAMHHMQFKRSWNLAHQPEAQMDRPPPSSQTDRPPMVYKPTPAYMARPPPMMVYKPTPAYMARPPPMMVYKPTPSAQMARSPPMMGYKPESSGAYTTHGFNYDGSTLPQLGDWHTPNQGSGEGSSKNLKFDPFKRFKQ